MTKTGLILSEILPFYLRLAVLVAATLAIDLGLHALNLAWIGRYLGIPGVILVAVSFGHSLRKRGLIGFGNPVILLRMHEWLAWIGSTLILVHAGIHFNAVLAWLAVAAMMINIASGLTGKYLVQRAHFWIKNAKAELHASALSDSAIDQQLHWDSLGAGLVRKWRTIHLPIALIFAVLATAHIIASLVFWNWK